MPAKPAFTTKIVGERLHLIVTGTWTINASADLEHAARDLLAAAHSALKITIDLDKVERIDTAGAWLVDRVRTDLLAHGIDAEYGVTKTEFALLLSEAKYQEFPHKLEKQGNLFTNILADVGETVIGVFRNLMLGVTFLGEVIQSLIKVLLNPARFRATSVVFHIKTEIIKHIISKCN
jgi:phospholipid/cholesterol/gamma-HCH transport system permease protein